MNDKRFDDIIRSKLTNLKSDAKPDWQSFKQKQDALNSQLSDAQFDNQMAEKLSNHTVKYNVDHWIALRQRINHIAFLRKQIFSIKFLELAIFLLLFGTLGNFNYFLPNIYPSADLLKTEHLLNTEDQILDDNQFQSFEKSQDNEQAIPLNSNTNISQKPSGDSSKTSDYNLQSTHVGELASSVTEDSGNSVVSTNSKQRQVESNYEKSSIGSQVLSKKLSFNIEAIPSLNKNQELLSQLNSSLPDLNSIYAGSDFGIKPIKFSEKAQWLHFYSSFDNNMIFTPDDIAYNTTARTTEMYGFTAGLGFSHQNNKFEYFTGIAYSSYDKPWNFTIQYGNSSGWYSFVLTNIHYDMISVPLELRYHLIQNEEWSLYANAGFDNLFIVDADYTRVNNFLGGAASPMENNPPGSDAPISPFEEERYFNRGIFNGDSFEENYFVRANVGIGFQRNITPKLSVYFNGTLHKTILNGSLGPNNDRINKYAVGFGIKNKF